jgi:hypothetical protein
MLQTSQNPRRLIKGVDTSGNSALSLVCMEGHLVIVQFICTHQNREGRPSLMEAIRYGRDAVASYLVDKAASVFMKDNEGSSVLEMAESTLKTLGEDEWLYSQCENETLVKFLDRKTNREHFTRVIDFCKARSKTLKKSRQRSSSRLDGKKRIKFVRTEAGLATQMSVYTNTFTAPMAGESKTFALLIRGAPFDDVFAVSEYSQGYFGNTDGCLDREEWTMKAFMFSRVLEHTLEANSKDGNVVGSYNACHAEKQVMTYVLWKHTLIHEAITNDMDEEVERTCMKLHQLKESEPSAVRLRSDIYINRPSCSDCKRFQDRISIVADIDSNIRIG